MAALITNLFTTKFAILKWFQMLCCIITVLFLIDGRMQWWPYTLVFICAIILGILCFATLLIHYFVIQSNNRAKIPLSSLELVFNVIALFVSLGFAVLLIIDYAKMMGGQFDHHRYQPPQNIGKPGWRNRILVVFIAQVLAAICFGISLLEAKKIRSR